MNSTSSHPIDNKSHLYEVFIYLVISLMMQVVSLPLNIYVLQMIVKSVKRGAASEFFPINLCVCEIIIFVNLALSFVNISLYEDYQNKPLKYIIKSLFYTHCISRNFFQCCVCVERYVAVIHPIIYLKYKPLRYRTALSVVAWIIVLALGALGSGLELRNALYYILLPEYLLVFSIKIICSIAVLKALRKPGPGEKLSAKDAESNRMKKKAFLVIVIILAFMLITYCPIMSLIFVYDSLTKAQAEECIIVISYFVIFSGTVQPFLYLQRVGKLPFISVLKFC